MDEFYTIKQASIFLKVHHLTVRRYIKEGKLKAYRIGGNVRVTLDDLKNFTQNFSSSPKSPSRTTSDSSQTKSLSLADPIFRMKGRGLSLNRIE